MSDLFSRAVVALEPADQPIDIEDDLIQLLQTSVQAVISLTELQQASAEEHHFCTLSSKSQEAGLLCTIC